jgi:Ca2+-binding RTX toxin-like protein
MATLQQTRIRGRAAVRPAPATRCRPRPSRRSSIRQAIERLESRTLLSTIVWSNRGTLSDDSDRFAREYGADAESARRIVDRVLADWATIVEDFHYRDGGNSYTVLLDARDLNGFRGVAFDIRTDADGKPTQCSIAMDDDGGEQAWYFDPVPDDDAEFTELRHAFAAAMPGSGAASDFYRTVAHEVGHCLGIASPQSRSLAIGRFLTPTRIADPVSPSARLYLFSGPSITATLTDRQGGHTFEGPSVAGLPIHPDDLLNPGRAFRPPPIVRARISDTNALILQDAYGYTIRLPSQTNTLLAELNRSTGELIVRGTPGDQADTIAVDWPAAGQLRVRVNDTAELFDAASVASMHIQSGGGDDTVAVDLADATALPAGGVTCDAGTGSDRLIVLRDSDLTLGDAGLVSDWGTIALSGVEAAELVGGSQANRLDARAFSGPVTLDGGAGDDTLLGGARDDLLQATAGRDHLDGGAGNDTLDGAAAGSLPVALIGGSGVDRLLVQADGDLTLTATELTTSATVVPLDGIDEAGVLGGAGGNRFDASAFPGPVTLDGAAGDDVLIGGPASDHLSGGPGADQLAGGDGDDTIEDSAAELAAGQILDGGAGSDQLTFTGDVDMLLADLSLTITGPAVVSLVAIESARLTGGGGANRLDASWFAGPVSLDGAAGNDTLLGGPQADELLGNSGDDVLESSPGRDTLAGGSGHDSLDLQGGGFDDALDGGPGTDLLRFAADLDMTLDDTRFAVAVLGSVTFADVEQAELAGGGSGNRLDASAFSGAVTLIGGAGDDLLRGGAGVDRLAGGDGDDTLDGGAGSGPAGSYDGGDGTDQLEVRGGSVRLSATGVAFAGLDVMPLTGIEQANLLGGPAADRLDAAQFAGPVTLDGGDGNDTLLGGSGADWFFSSAGNDSMDGGAGLDTLDFSSSPRGVRVDLTRRTATGHGSDRVLAMDRLIGSPHHDALVGSRDAEWLAGGDGRDTIAGGDAADTLEGGDGNDRLDGGDGADSVAGGPGNDRIAGGSGADSLSGGGGDDRLDGGDDADQIDGGDDSDRLDGGDDPDTLAGGSGNDTLKGGRGRDSLDGGRGRDALAGGDDADTLEGGTDEDRLAGDRGDDSLDGDDHADTLSGGSGNDLLAGGDGDDSLTGDDGHDRLDGGGANDTLRGGSGDDSLFGAAGDDSLAGDAGNDLLAGGADTDLLRGGSGNDALDGGPGPDSLFGETGIDVLNSDADDVVVDAGPQ